MKTHYCRELQRVFVRLTHAYRALVRWSRIERGLIADHGSRNSKGHARRLATQTMIYKMATTSLSNCVSDRAKKLNFSENIRRYFHLNSSKRYADIRLSIYQKHDFVDYSWLELWYLERCHLCYFTENLVFLLFAIFKKHPIFETLWQEQEEKTRLVLLLKVLRKGSSMLRFFVFSFNEG